MYTGLQETQKAAVLLYYTEAQSLDSTGHVRTGTDSAVLFRPPHDLISHWECLSSRASSCLILVTWLTLFSHSVLGYVANTDFQMRKYYPIEVLVQNRAFFLMEPVTL